MKQSMRISFACGQMRKHEGSEMMFCKVGGGKGRQGVFQMQVGY